MYRPGSVTRPTCGHVTLLTVNHFPFAFSTALQRLIVSAWIIATGGPLRERSQYVCALDLIRESQPSFRRRPEL